MMTLKTERLERILLSEKKSAYLKREEQRKEDVTKKVGGLYKLMTSHSCAIFCSSYMSGNVVLSGQQTEEHRFRSPVTG